MNITIPSNATTQSIQNAYVPPRGATHFRFITPGKRPVIDKIKNLDTLAGCSGMLEFGKVQFDGRGRHAKIKGFTGMGEAIVPESEPETPIQKPVPTLNATEIAVVRGVIAEMEYQGWDFGYPDNVKVAGLTKHQIAGYLSDLQSKGLISIQPEGNLNFMAANREQLEAITAAAPVSSEVENAKVARRPRMTKLNRILGHSACAVAKALGQAGVKYAEADRIFRAHGIEMPKASLSVQLGFGRNPASWERHGKPAEVTAAQISELRVSHCVHVVDGIRRGGAR